MIRGAAPACTITGTAANASYFAFRALRASSTSASPPNK